MNHHCARTTSRFRPCIILKALAAILSVPLAGAIEAGAELDTSIPFEQRVCRLYWNGLQPTVHDGTKTPEGRSRYIPTKPWRGLSPEEITDVVADMGTEVWSATSSWTDHGSFWASKMVKRCTEVPEDYQPRMVKRAHERGMMVLALEQLVELENTPLPPYSKELSKWVVQTIEGNHWGQMNALCTPYIDWMGRYMAEHVTVGMMDGFWFDGTPGAGDVGPYGQEAYLRDTGKPVPAKLDWDSQEFKEWFVWRYDKDVEFFNRVTAPAIREKPYTVAIMNYYARPMDRRWDSAHPMRRLDDINWYPAIESGESSLNAKVGRALTPRTECWMWAQWFVNEVSHGVLPYFDPDTGIAKGLRVIAHGIAPCFAGFSADIETWKDSVKAMFDEFKKRRPYMTGETVKYSALLVSQQMRDFHDSSAMWSAVTRLEDIHRTEHLLTDVIFDDSLTPERLAPYPVISLANSTCLSDAQCEALAAYVLDGGTLLATAETSLYDEWGNRRENFGLAELLGADYVETREESATILVPQTEELKGAFERFVVFVAPSVHFTVRSDTNTEVLFTHSSRAIHALSVREDPYDSNVPAIIRRRVGKGTVYYVGPDIGHGYRRDNLPRVARLVGHLLRDAAEPPVEFDAPKVIEVTALQPDDNRLVLHLINVSSLSSNTKKMAPLANIGVRVNQGAVKRATLAISGTKLKVKNNRILVPNVGHSEVVVLELR
jgi:type 1 glutamine amidotransferase